MAIELEKYRSAVFDCDGVILDSNGMKTDAFRKSLEGEDPDLIHHFLDYHHANGGISRHVKFRHFYQNMKKVPDFERPAVETMRRYSQLSREGLMTCPEIPGVRNLLNYFRSRNVSCFMISGGDEEEVQTVFAKRELERYFGGIFGSPTTKLENLDRIISSGKFKKPAVYFGDARADMEAAAAREIKFVFVAGHSEWKDGLSVCQRKGIPIVTDFSSL